MSRRRGLLTGARARRVVQGIFVLVFLGLLLMARPRPGSAPSRWWQAFFLLDPLILLATSLAARAVLWAAIWAIGLIAVTLVLGRVFCGWACPLGTVHAAASWLFRPRSARQPQHWSPWQLAKYYLLLAFLVMAALGAHWVCIFDPLVLLYRTTTTVLLPGAQWAVEEGSTAIYRADPGIGPARLALVTEPVYRLCRDHVFVVRGQAFLGGGLIAGLFLVTLALNAYRPRFWCRYLCPLGALLGVFAWRPVLRREVAAERCNQCDLCGMSCQGAAAVSAGGGWKPSECLGCLNCSDSCARRSLSFRWVWPWRPAPAVERLGVTRRAAMGAAVGGLAALPLLHLGPQARGKRYNPDLVRPPGARSEKEFLARCTACGLCMKVCPTGGLQPTLAEAGLEGLWTPRLVPRIGYCEYSCNLCGQVCPTQAIEPLAVEQKQKVRIGLASFDVTRCIPYAYGRNCMVCEEHCPIPHKAIYSLEVEIVDRHGQRVTIKQPHVDPELCIGCGVCEHVCPFKDRPAIRVTSANETRHPENQPILPEESPYES